MCSEIFSEIIPFCPIIEADDGEILYGDIRGPMM